jgi:hypothetical protein
MFSSIKRKIRRKMYLAIWFFLSPLLKATSSPQRVILTCTRGDGGGAQWHGRFSVMAFADEHNMSYSPSDFGAVMPQNTAEQRLLWSRLFEGEFSAFSDLPGPVKADSLLSLLIEVLKSRLGNRVTLIDVGHLHSFTDLNPDAVAKSLQVHKVRYCNPAQVDTSQFSEKAIAMHVRRGLEWESNFTPNRLTGDEEVLRRLDVVVQISKFSSGTIYSGAPIPGIDSKLPAGFETDSESDEFVVLHHLINSEVAILAKSCMSYVAGAFARGDVYYDPFFHPPLPGWKILDSEFVNKLRPNSEA